MTAATLHLPLFVGFPNGFGNVRLYVLSPNYSIFSGLYLNVCPRPQGNLNFYSNFASPRTFSQV